MKIIIYLTFCLQLTFAEDLVDILSSELDRSMNGLSKEEIAPYYIAYAVTESERVTITSSFGKIITNNHQKDRILDIDLRVGSYDLDNSHIIRGQSFGFGSMVGSPNLPIEDNEMAIRQKIWKTTDKKFKAAIETFEKVVSNRKVKIEEEDLSADFTKQAPLVDIQGKAKRIIIDKEIWENRLNSLSELFMNKPWLFVGTVNLNIEFRTKYFVDTEGKKLRWSEPYARISVYAKTKAEDGMSLPLYESYFSHDISGLPSNSDLETDIKSLISTLDGLRSADLMGTYSGPAILSGEAAGVFFHEIFGHRVEGHREKDPNSAQTFKQSVGKEILPDFIDVTFDPTRSKLGDYEISGNYPYDDEGSKAKAVKTVEDGKFQSFLMSRSPIENFPESNGHGRRQAGRSPVSRQSNLIVESNKTVDLPVLKDELRKICKEKDLEFGLMFDVVQGGFTFTGRTVPNAFNVLPLVVYKIYADGRPDELVRGVDLIGTPLTTFKNITHVANDLGVFNGICGAESGGVPVSACAPSMLVSNIEIQKKQKSQAKLPILESPIQKAQ